MNCHGFEMVVNDLARNQIMDASAKTDALRHADACPRCAARLADEQMLTAGLSRLAANAQDDEAPPRVEIALLAALGEQQKEVAAPRSARRWSRWAVAAAIAALVVAGALVALRIDKASTTERAKSADETEQPEKQVVAGPNKVVPESSIEKDKEQPVATQDHSSQKAKPPRRIMQNIDRTKSVKATANRPAPSNASEIATDFISLVQGEDLRRMEGGQVVRVEMPRSALMSYGLPMNMERANERIKADVVIGNDGLARAIRFVR